jgi:dCTP deaminase
VCSSDLDYACVNSASLDIHLGDSFLVEKLNPDCRFISLARKEQLDMRKESFAERSNKYYLHSGEFILAQSQEVFNLPNNISAEYKLKSSMARIGLEHLNAGWCDAGWNGSVLTLELKNMTRYHIIELEAGARIGQLVFFRHEAVPADKSYAARGRYNGHKEVSGVVKKANDE